MMRPTWGSLRNAKSLIGCSMSTRIWRTALIALGAVMVWGGVLMAQVVIPASESSGPPLGLIGTGLSGSWYFDPNDPTRPCPDIATAQSIIASEPAHATFTAAVLNYEGGDMTHVDAFLSSHFQKDGKTLNPPSSDPQRTSIYDMVGCLEITAGDLMATFALGSDDGSFLTLGKSGIEAVRNDGTHGYQIVKGDVQFEVPGLYPIEVIYYNQDFQGGTGGARFTVETTLGFGGSLEPRNLYPTCP